jgi:6-phosphogluconolactonase
MFSDMRNDLELTLRSDPDDLVACVVDQIMELLLLSLLEKNRFDLALTGGTLGVRLSAELLTRINQAGDLTGLHIWFSDERFVSLESTERNASLFTECLMNKTPQIHFVKSTGEASNVQEAVALYEAELGKFVMDVCILGLGRDGHVASLFPENWLAQRTSSTKAVAVINAPKPPAQRVSFSMGFINSSNQVWIIAAGSSKALAVSQLLMSDHSVPAGNVRGNKSTRLFVDEQALSLSN